MKSIKFTSATIEAAFRITQVESDAEKAVERIAERFQLDEAGARELHALALDFKGQRNRSRALKGIGGGYLVLAVSLIAAWVIPSVGSALDSFLNGFAEYVVIVAAIPVFTGGWVIIRSTPGLVRKLTWSLAPVGSIVLAIAVMVILANGIPADPAISDVNWTQQQPVLDSPGMARFAGQVTDNNPDWALKDLSLRVELFDANQVSIGSQDVDLQIGRVKPGESKEYSVLVQWPDGAAFQQQHLLSNWVR